MEKWYKNIYRRNLIDMHINDISEEYLSNFNADDYFKYLKESEVKSPMIYIQSHIGLCYFPTKVSKTHKFFIKNPNEIKKLINLCKEDGMKVVIYYSLIFNNQAVNDHPSWEQIDYEGKTWRDHGQRYGLACPNNLEYRRFLEEQIKEIANEYKNVDGIFYDMPYWEMNCHCPSCKSKYKEETGNELPTAINWKDPNWRTFVRKKQTFMGEFVKYVTELTHKYMPWVTVEYNYAAGIACNWLAGSTELINEQSEFTGGDLYGDLYNHSFTAKYYYGITKNQPFEYMTCRCNKSLREHTITKSKNMLEAEIMLTALHHGASLIIDAINPDGTLDHRVSKLLGETFKKEIPYEPYMDKGELKANVGVYFDSQTQFSEDRKPYNKEAALNVTRTMIERHVPVSVLANYHLKNLKQYDLIIAPMVEDFNNDEVLNFIDYVKEGGTLYLSGKSDPRLIKEFFDGKVNGVTYGDSKYQPVYKGYGECQCYVYPITKEYEKYFNDFNEKYPLPILFKCPLVEFSKGEVKACLEMPYTDPDNNYKFASIHTNPPAKSTNIPAIIEVNCGKGKVIWSLNPIEADSRFNFKDVFMNIVSAYIKPMFNIKASKYVEAILFEDESNFYLSLFDLNFIEEIIEREYEISLPNSIKEAFDILNSKNIKIESNKLKGKFQKYICLKLSK